MKTQTLGKSRLVSSRLSYGCMRISGTWDPASYTPKLEAEGKKAVLAAVDAGYTLFDHADIYGMGLCETLFGKVLKENPGLRKTPLVFLTAVVNKDELGAPEGKIGGEMYIAKPLNVKGVISVIERTLGK